VRGAVAIVKELSLSWRARVLAARRELLVE
jgi:hypothetical protein